MSIEQDVLAALRGSPPGRVPWTMYGILLPRSDVERAARNAGLGLVRPMGICQVHYPNVEIVERRVQKGDRLFIERTYHTPVGSVSERLRTDSTIYNEGYESQWVVDYMIKALHDYDVVCFIVEDALYEPDYAGYLTARERFGDDIVIPASMGRCPLQRLSIELAGVERLAYDLHDYPEVVEGLLGVMEERQREVYHLAADSPAELIWSPDNISASRTSARWFERYILPFYNRQAPLLHERGKLYVAHMDGSLRGLKDLIARCDLDVIEAFTPPPMGDLPTEEALAAWPGKAIWLNFPESLFFDGYAAVHEQTLDLLRRLYSRGRFVLGLTEDMPEDCWREGLLAMAEAVRRYQEEAQA